MNNFAIYLNNNEDPQNEFISMMKTAALDKISAILKLSVRFSNSDKHSMTRGYRKQITKNNHQYFLKPVSGQMKLTMQKLGRNLDFAKPQFNAEFIFTELGFTFNDKQYRSVVHLVEYFSNYPSLERVRFVHSIVSVFIIN